MLHYLSFNFFIFQVENIKHYSFNLYVPFFSDIEHICLKTISFIMNCILDSFPMFFIGLFIFFLINL